jgi:hypothetical protein
MSEFSGFALAGVERISMPNVSASDQQMMSMADSRLRRFVGRAERASGSEELRPGIHFGMLPEQRSPLAFGHAAPHTELHLVVKRVGEALGGHQTRPANRRSVPLRRSADEQIVGIGEATRACNTQPMRERKGARGAGRAGVTRPSYQQSHRIPPHRQLVDES